MFLPHKYLKVTYTAANRWLACTSVQFLLNTVVPIYGANAGKETLSW